MTFNYAQSKSLNLAKKIILALTYDLFEVLLPLLCGTNLTFWERLLQDSWNKTAKLAKSSEVSVQRNSLRGQNPRAVSIPQLLRGTSAVRPPETVQKDHTNKGTSLDLDRVNYARPLKVTKAFL
jgi:hypothetical protein